MRSISSRIVLLIAGAAVAPLLVYGIVSIGSLRRGTEQSVTGGNLAVARQISERIAQYFDNTRRILSSVADQIQGTQLAPWQQERILRNHVLDFPEFRELTMFDSAGKVIATSRATSTRLIPPGGASDDPVYIASPRLDADELPTTTMAIELRSPESRAGWIVAEISLEELWRAVDRIRVGQSGYALLLDETDRIIAHGDPDQKRLIADAARATPEQDLARRIGPSSAAVDAARFTTVNGTAVVAAHEIGHLMGAHHHYANCVEGIAPDELLGLELTPCTLMFNAVNPASLRFSAVNGPVVRGHAVDFASP